MREDKTDPATVVPVADEAALSNSFEDFFEIEHDRLLGALYLVTGNKHDAEELMQEAFVRVWERWDLVQAFANPTGYLYRTAMNAFRMRASSHCGWGRSHGPYVRRRHRCPLRTARRGDRRGDRSDRGGRTNLHVDLDAGGGVAGVEFLYPRT